MHSIVADGDAEAAFLKEYRMDKSKLKSEIFSIVENSSNYTRNKMVQALEDMPACGLWTVSAWLLTSNRS